MSNISEFMRCRLVFAEFAVFVAWVALSLPCNAQSDFQLGVGVHMGDYPLGVTQSAVDALDLDFRGDVPWSAIEVTQGNLQYPTVNSPLRNLDLLVSDAASHGRHPLLILAYGNRYYDEGGLVVSAEGRAAFAKYAAFTVTHFRGRASEFEVWNEWNHGLGTPAGHKPTATDATTYVELLRTVYQSIKSANPEAQVIGGVVAGTDTSWTEQFAQAQGLKYVDGFSVHPYVHCNARRPKPPENVRLSSLVAKPSTTGAGANRLTFANAAFSPIPGTPEQAIGWLDEVRAILDKYSPGKQIPVYVSEIGWPTSQGQCGVPDATAAAYLQRFMLLAAARPWIAGVWWYDLFDDGADPTSREFRFGLERQDRSPKPAYQALAAIRELLKSPRHVTSTIDADGVVEVKGADAKNKSFYASWLPTDNFDSTLQSARLSDLQTSGYRVPTTSQRADSSMIGATPVVLVQP